MSTNVEQTGKLGQSVWLDQLKRSLVTTGKLSSLVKDEGLLGMTSNPAIFHASIAKSSDYDYAVNALAHQGVGPVDKTYEALAITDIQFACDIMREVYDKTDGIDGYVSLEVSPYLAFDTTATIEEGKRLWGEVGRDNLMIKVPGTPEGVPAISALLAEGINVNVTLLFSVDAYKKAAEAYLEGVEKYMKAGGDPKRLASVASFFVSRIDSLVDKQLDAKAKEGLDAAAVKKLKGQVAIANSINAYAYFKELCATGRWKKLAEAGARPQRLLWASTSVKSKEYPATMYCDRLIAAQTVNTMPMETFEAFQKSGTVRDVLTEDWDKLAAWADDITMSLDKTGVSLAKATGDLLTEAVTKFAEPFDQLLGHLEGMRRTAAARLVPMELKADAGLLKQVDDEAAKWEKDGTNRKLWAGDVGVWSNADENKWLGWLTIVDTELEHVDELTKLGEEVKSAGFTDVVVLGMGGSSLAPDVFAKTLPAGKGFPKLHVLDSTVPAQIEALAGKLNVSKTCFIVASKSGGTIEPNTFKQFFWDKVEKAVGADKAGEHFIAVTDPGTKMNQVAARDRFRHIAFGKPDVGGRFSALSKFGLVPLALMGGDVGTFLRRAQEMVFACSAAVPATLNPGLKLGVLLGLAGKAGRDKLTIVASDKIASFGGWMEQLVAESTGKKGKGIVPVAGEAVGAPDAYGSDRVFAYLKVKGDDALDAKVDALEKAGHPVVRCVLADAFDVAQEMFRWEFATAVAGAVLQLNPFDQPDVEAAKIAAKKLMEAHAKGGGAGEKSPALVEEGPVKVYGKPAGGGADGVSLKTVIAGHLGSVQPGDYVAFNAYLDMNDENQQLLEQIRAAAGMKTKAATTVGFGPRFLHSTGQLHKGGPNTGVFFQFTGDDKKDLPVPGESFTFGVLKTAQAQGDYDVLTERGRRILRLHLADEAGGLKAVLKAME